VGTRQAGARNGSGFSELVTRICDMGSVPPRPRPRAGTAGRSRPGSGRRGTGSSQVSRSRSSLSLTRKVKISNMDSEIGMKHPSHQTMPPPPPLMITDNDTVRPPPPTSGIHRQNLELDSEGELRPSSESSAR
jgi:hypothetical protein